MRRLLPALGVAVAVAAVPGTAVAQAKDKTYEVCRVTATSGATALVQTLKAPGATMTVTAVGPLTTTYFAVYELTVPTSCATLYADSQAPGPYPTGINLEGDVSHKPVLKS